MYDTTEATLRRHVNKTELFNKTLRLHTLFSNVDLGVKNGCGVFGSNESSYDLVESGHVVYQIEDLGDMIGVITFF